MSFHETTPEEHDGNRCPYCGSDDIEGGFVEIVGRLAEQDVCCCSCGRTWRDEYVIHGWYDDGEDDGD